MLSTELLKAALTISASSAAGASVINHVAGRSRNRREDKVARLVAVTGTSRTNVIGIMRQLEEAGFGRFVRTGSVHDARFVWREL